MLLLMRRAAFHLSSSYHQLVVDPTVSVFGRAGEPADIAHPYGQGDHVNPCSSTTGSPSPPIRPNTVVSFTATSNWSKSSTMPVSLSQKPALVQEPQGFGHGCGQPRSSDNGVSRMTSWIRCSATM